MKNLPSLIGRQKFLASYIHLIGSRLGRTQKFKHLFLISREFKGNFDYDFVPYKFGAYSFTMENDLKVLERKKITDDASYLKKYFLSMSSEDQGRLIEFFEKYQGIVGSKNETIRVTYEKYPYFAINSTIIDQYPEARARMTAVKESLRAQNGVTLFTIGYESKSIEGFFNQLIENNVNTLVDVRCNRKSMKFGFSEKKLSSICDLLGIQYVGLSELGIESEKRKDLETMEDYQRLFADYQKSLRSRKKYILALKEILAKDSRIALMCFELDPQMCHRTVLAREFLKLYDVPLKEL